MDSGTVELSPNPWLTKTLMEPGPSLRLSSILLEVRGQLHWNGRWPSGPGGLLRISRLLAQGDCVILRRGDS